MSRKACLRIVALTTTLMIASVGCSSSDASPTKVLSAQELADSLLVAKDLEGTWKLNAIPEGADLSSAGVIDETNRDKLPQIELCDKASQASRDAIKSIEWGAFRQIDKTVDDPIKPPKDREGHMAFVQEWLASGDADELESIFGDVETAFTECLGDIPAGEEGPGTITNVEIKPVGDQRIAALARFEEAGGVGTWNIYSVFVRYGTVLMGMTAVDIVLGDLSAELALGDLDSILSTALSKI